jgi:hypothetical protein
MAFSTALALSGLRQTTAAANTEEGPRRRLAGEHDVDVLEYPECKGRLSILAAVIALTSMHRILDKAPSSHPAVMR